MSTFMRSLSACKSIEAMQRERCQEIERTSAFVKPAEPKQPRKPQGVHIMQQELRGDHTLYRCSCGCWSKILNGHGMHQWKRARQSFDAHVPRDARESA